MVGAGTGRAAAHAEPTGQFCLARCGQRGAFFVANTDPFHAVLCPDRLRKGVERVAYDTEHLADADVAKRLHEHCCYRL